MTEPLQIMDGIDADYKRLDDLEKLLDKVIALLDDAEEQWLVVYDKVAEDLKAEMEEQGRKGDPAEHTIVSVARRENRVAFTNWRRAKHARDKIQVQIKTKQVSLSGRQTHLNALKSETFRPSHGQQPQWTPKAA